VVAGTVANEEVVHPIDTRETLAFFPKSDGKGPESRIADIGVGAKEFGFSHAGLAGWLGRLRHEYGLVIMDAGLVENAVGWGPWADTALIICDPSRACDAEWTTAWDRLEESGTHVLGIIETRV
jgi:hypothetical protein